MKLLFFAPIVAALMLGTLAQLEDLSYDAQEKVLKHSSDAVAALDCAYEGRPLTDCAPDIVGTDYNEEIRRTNEILEDIRRGTTPSN